MPPPSGKLVPLELVHWHPEKRAMLWVGRDARSGSLAPGKGPAAWAQVECCGYLWPKQGGEAAQIADGVECRITGTSKKLMVRQLELLRDIF